MAGLSIPGVTDTYNTNDTVEKLMQIERIPLTREQNQLDEYKSQQTAWREVNTQLTSLRDSTKTLYSYENPFNNKLTTSTDENAITATANRGADIQSFKVDVIQPATADRFLSDELSSDYKVPAGVYTYKVGEKQLTVNWKGGSLKDFSAAINKRSNGIVKSMLVGASAGKKTLLIESLSTGKENKLIFEGAAKDFAIETGMISPVKSSTSSFGAKTAEIKQLTYKEQGKQTRMPEMSLTRTTVSDGKVTVQPRGGYEVSIPDSVKNNQNMHIAFKVRATGLTDITQALNETAAEPEIPDGFYAEFGGISIKNATSDTLLPKSTVKPEPLSPVTDKNIFYAVFSDGTERVISTPDILSGNEVSIDLSVSDYKGISSISVRNANTSYSLEVSEFNAYDANANLGYSPNHAVAEAGDAIIKYEGITITRPTNEIDDVVPEITLNVHDKTEKTATINVKVDKEASKNALIEFVGKYNQAVAKLNVLSQNKPDIVNELDYLSDDEKEKLTKQLGMFQTDSSLSNIKSNMQTILSSNYRFTENTEVTTLSTLGISTNASGFTGSYSASRLRGYLEIDEKKLDAALENHINEIKDLFGYDTDGDLIIDDGIAFRLDKQITAYTQTGGILALKTSTLDSKIKSSETRITKLEDQMDKKEAELRQKYSTMQGSLSNLENQQNTINNFTRQQNNQNNR
ncbi:MAG: flagellar filament capping protein FliD [Treponema sp.]|nr:flagellar filament capping protein FliD [Treponema sp.]